MKIFVGGDSAGKPLADLLGAHLRSMGHDVVDGEAERLSDKELYADLAERGARSVLARKCERGILCCGTGIGVAISANKVPGIRAAQTHDTYSAERAVKSNNAQIITLGARVVGGELAKAIVDKFIESSFDPHGASAQNVLGIDRLDKVKWVQTGSPR